MRPARIAAFLLLVLVPLGLLAWLGLRVARGEREAVRVRLADLVLGRLAEADRLVAARLGEVERELLARTAGIEPGPDAERLRDLVRHDGWVSGVLLLDGKGRVLQPAPLQPRSDAEERLLARVRPLLEERAFVRPPAPEGAIAGSDRAATHGWQERFLDRGLSLFFWRRTPNSDVLVLEVERARLFAELVSVLPDTAGDGKSSRGDGERFVLVDATGSTLYQWGRREPAGGERPAATLALSPPLGSLALRGFVAPGGEALGGSVVFNLATGLLGIALALSGLAAYLYREYARDLREARVRVSFVDQVSHELKTPLTNVRMYAELLEGRLDPGDPEAGRYLEVIISESQRLSRLIANVLTLSRSHRGRLSLQRAAGVVDAALERALDPFRPALAAKGVEVQLRPGAPALVSLDPDAVGQIVGNLVSNVEKYAAAGGLVEVTSAQDGERTTIEVRDRGPGVAPGDRERIFQPFHRVGRPLTDTALGTGIGLSIARQLAELHGGSLVLVPAEVGACFRVCLHTPPAGAGGAEVAG